MAIGGKRLLLIIGLLSVVCALRYVFSMATMFVNNDEDNVTKNYFVSLTWLKVSKCMLLQH